VAVVVDSGGDDVAVVGIDEGVLSSLGGDVAGASLGWVVGSDRVASWGCVVEGRGWWRCCWVVMWQRGEGGDMVAG
jgi:hypothetical protein